MDQSCTCGEVNNFQKDQEFINDCSVMDKKGCMFHHQSNSSGTKPLCKKENCPNEDKVSASNCMNGNHLSNVEEQFSVNLASRNSAGPNSMPRSYSNENASSTIIFTGNPKDSDVSTESSNATAGREHISAKRDISSDTGPPVNRGSSGLDAGTPSVKQKCMAESSCSNSMHAVLPVASSNDSYQDTSTEAKSSDPQNGGSSSSNPVGFDFSTGEPVTSHSVSAMDAQITQSSVTKTRARSKMKVSKIFRHPNAFVVKAGNNSISSLQKQRNDNEASQDTAEHFQEDYALGTPREGAKITEESTYDGTSECTSLNKASNGHAINGRAIHFGTKNDFCCLTETKEEVLSCYERDDGASGCFQHIIDPKKSIKNEEFSVSRCLSKKLDPAGTYELTGLPHVEKLSESIMAIPEDIATTGQSACVAGFDLNEVIHGNESNGHQQLACESRYFFNVIRVVAKSGVPPNFPMTPLKFEGELGWKGSAATSAFHPTHLKSSDGKASACKSDGSLQKPKGFIGIDLNVAAAEESAACKMHGELGMPPVHLVQESSSKFSSSRAEGLNIDLNCLGDNTDVSPRASLRVKSPENSMVDINLNDHPSSSDTHDDVYQQYKTSQNMDKMQSDANVPFAANFRDHDLSFVRPAYWTDLNSIQFFGQAQSRPVLLATNNLIPPMEQMQKVIPSQPKLPYIIHALPSGSYPSSGPFFIGPSGSISSSIHSPSTIPDARDPRVHSVFPQIMKDFMPPSFSGTPYFMQVAHGRSQNEVSNKKPIIDVVNGQSVAVHESLSDHRHYLFPSKCLTTEEQMKSLHQGALGANIPLKRREPDGGWDSYQLVGDKQWSSRN